MAKKKYATGLGGLRVEHSCGDNNYVRTRYLSTEPGHYTPPESMLLGKVEPKAEVVIKQPADTTKAQDAAVKKASKKDLKEKNIT